MNRQAVSSSNLRAVGYDAITHQLEVEFQNGRIYLYSEVPEGTYLGLMHAASKGGYLDDFIKGHFVCRRVC